jgi:hypothetical protein
MPNSSINASVSASLRSFLARRRARKALRTPSFCKINSCINWPYTYRNRPRSSPADGEVSRAPAQGGFMLHARPVRTDSDSSPQVIETRGSRDEDAREGGQPMRSVAGSIFLDHDRQRAGGILVRARGRTAEQGTQMGASRAPYYQDRAAVLTGASHNRVSRSPNKATVIEQPAMSRDVTSEPVRWRVTPTPRPARMRRAALTIR